ncbi:hypothetical protein V5O48_019518, partial [Marasmius crinis-equi]
DGMVYINTVGKRPEMSSYRSPAPWIGLEVTISDKMYQNRRGIIQDVSRGRYGDCLVLDLYLTDLHCSARVEDHNVFVGRSRTRLWDLYPIDPDRQRYYYIHRNMRDMRSGRVPWLNVQVGIISGADKGYTGVVRDVNRAPATAKQALSGLEVTVELDIFRVGVGLP